MNNALGISLSARLRIIADELAPGITSEDIESWVDLLGGPVDAALKAARVEELRNILEDTISATTASGVLFNISERIAELEASNAK